MALNHGNASRSRSLSSSSASSYHSLSEKGSSLTSEILPIGQYNSKKAKLCASIRWLVSKAYSSSTIPPDIRNPFFKDKEGEDHLRPAVIYQLSSGELYSRACANIFPPSLHQWQGHWSVIQGLSRRGIYVVDDKRQPVTEAVLTQTQRIKLNAHLAVMDSIMTAFTGEVVSIEKIVQAVRRITTFNASSELPFDLENALVFWVNKVCIAEKHRMERERRNQQEQLIQSQAQKVRIRRQQLQSKELPSVPVIKNVTKDVSDGRCLCLLMHHYCPQLFSLDDVDLHDTMSFADSVNNLQQVEAFLETHLPQIHCFTFEDLLYSPEVLRVNILALIAELFYWFEVVKPEHLGFTQEQGQKVPATPESGRSRVQQLPPIPVNSLTKKGIHGDSQLPRSELHSAASNPEVNVITTASPRRSQSLLLHRERKQPKAIHADHREGLAKLRRASSLENIDTKESIQAWQCQEEAKDRLKPFGSSGSGDNQASSMRDSNTSNLLANVSIESDTNGSQHTLPSLNGRISKEGDNQQMFSSAEFENDEDMEVESLTSALSRISQRTEKPESHSLNEEVLLNRTSYDANGCPPDQELTKVTPLSSMSSKASMSLGSEPGQMKPSDEIYLRNGRSDQSGTNKERFEHLESVEPEIKMSAVTSSRRRLKLDIQPVETKQTERLLPAVVKPLKEKSHNMNKKEESGEGRKVGRNPREEKSERLPNPNGGSMTTWTRKQGAPRESESPESPDAMTPLSGESIADSLAGDVAMHRLAWQKPKPGVAPLQADPTSATNTHFYQSEEPHVAHSKHGEAFFIHTHAQPEQSLGCSSLSRTGTGSSFTIADKQYTAASAREAGIPVVSSLADLQATEDEDQATYGHQASPCNPSTYPNLHAAPLHKPISAWHPSESLSSNPNPSVNPHAQTNPSLHETSFKPNALHSDGDRSGFTHAESPRGHPNTGMDNIPHHHSSSPDKESSKLHADLIQRESGNDPRKPVLLTFNSNLSPDEKSSSKPFQFPPTSSLVIHSDKDGDHDQETNPSRKLVSQKEDLINFEKLEAQFAPVIHPKDATDVESTQKPAVNPGGLLITQSKPEITPHTEAIIVENSCMPVEPVSSNPNNQVLTTWGANSKPTPLCGIINTGGGNLNQASNPALGNMAQIRVRLEEKRRLMDSDKRKLERQWNKQRQRVGKAAFLQVLANQKKAKDIANEDQPMRTEDDQIHSEKLKTQDMYSREEIERSIERSKSQWSSNQARQEGKITFADLGSNKDRQISNKGAESPRLHRDVAPSQAVVASQLAAPSQSSESSPRRSESPQSIPEANTGKGSPGSSSGSHSPHMTSDEYNTSLEKLNANLSQLQNEIQRLSLRQEQMRSVMESPRPPSERSQSPQQAPPSDSKPFVAHSTSVAPVESTGFFLSSEMDKEPESFVLHENPIYDMAGTDPPSPRPVGPVQKVPNTGQGSISRSTEQTQAFKSPYPANQIPSASAETTYIIPPAPSPIRNKEVSDTPKNGTPQNVTRVLSSTPANEQPRNSDSLSNQHQPPLPTVTSLSNHRAQMSNKDKSPPEANDTGEVVKRPKKTPDKVASPTRKNRRSLYEIVGEGDADNGNNSEEENLVVIPLDSSGEPRDISGDVNTKAKGFVIAAETDQLDEVEKRKMLFLQNRLKKQEEEKAKRASREADMEKKREQNRRKQEEIEAKKAEEKARREQIRLEYQRRKQQEQQENEPTPVRRTKSSKPRPKSCLVEDQADFGRPATSRYADRDPDDYSAQKKSFTVSAPSVGGSSSLHKAPPVDGQVPEGAAGGSAGPKLYVKPTTKSNRHIITNAISHCVLAGTVNREHKDKVLEELAKAEAKHFIILFRDAQLQFRSLYGYSPDSEELVKLYGVGPRHITHKMYENLYKYNSGSKQFSKIPSKTMSVSVDGLTISSSYWLSKKGPGKKR